MMKFINEEDGYTAVELALSIIIGAVGTMLVFGGFLVLIILYNAAMG